MRDGVMSYLYLTSVFFSSLERGAQREQSQHEEAREGKSEPGREGVKQTLWEGEGEESWESQKEGETERTLPDRRRSKGKLAYQRRAV